MTYVYVASSWRNPMQPTVVAALAAAGVPHYDFRNPPNQSGFGWEELGDYNGDGLVDPSEYLKMIDHPIAEAGFASDFDAMQRADTVVLILPCGKSAHLELGWAVGAGKRTAILLDDQVQPELMYKMVDRITPSLDELLRWIVDDAPWPRTPVPGEVWTTTIKCGESITIIKEGEGETEGSWLVESPNGTRLWIPGDLFGPGGYDPPKPGQR